MAISVLLLATLPSCSAEDSSDGEVPALAVFHEMAALGGEQYLGTVKPADTENKDGYTQYTFDVNDGPVCMRGGPFQMATRKGTSNELLIFLQGGGACWDGLCQAFETSHPGVPDGGILNRALDSNPMADWNVAYVPYCDGSLFVGDIDIDKNNDGTIERYHRGRLNLSAALDVIHQEFPDPSRIIITGMSAGAYGSPLAGMLVRGLWPKPHITVIADGGFGLGKEENPDFVKGLLDEWGITPYIPESCSHCFDDGHATSIVSWALERDPNMSYLVITSLEDFVISGIFLQLSGTQYATAVKAESDEMLGKHPNQFGSFLYEGSKHTTLALDSSIDLSDVEDLPFDTNGLEISPKQLDALIGRFDVTKAQNTTVAEWLRRFIRDDDQFKSESD